MATVSDDFNRADGGLGASWTAVMGTWTVAGNAATRNALTTAAIGSARYNTDLATSDNSAQVQVAALVASTDVMSAGAACRYSPSAQTYYFASLQVETNGSASVNLGKVEAGTMTLLASTSPVTTSFPETVKVQAVGSTVKAFRGGVEVLSVTDTSITSGTRVGLHGRRRSSAANWSVDNFTGEDVGGGATQHAVSGLAAASSDATGTVTALRPVEGLAAATSGVLGSVSARLQAAGLAAAVTTAFASPTVVGGAVQHAVSGFAGATSEVPSPTLQRRAVVSGTVTATTTVLAAALVARLGVAGTVAAVSGVVGAVDVAAGPGEAVDIDVALAVTLLALRHAEVKVL